MSLLTDVEDKRNFRVAEDKAFVLSNGEKLFTLDQLSEAINLIEPDVFRAHVNEQKNDFASWVEGVFEEQTLAEQLRQHPTPLRMMVSIEKFLRLPNTAANPAEAQPQLHVVEGGQSVPTPPAPMQAAAPFAPTPESHQGGYDHQQAA